MFERLVSHHRTKVGTADADIDDVPDTFAGMAFPFAVADAIGKFRHFVEHGVNFRHDVLSIHEDACPFRCAQSDVQDGAVFRDVDFLATEHGCDPPAQIGFLGQLDEQFEGPVSDAILRIIQIEARRLDRQAFAALGVGGEKLSEMLFLDLLVVGGEGLPRRALGE